MPNLALSPRGSGRRKPGPWAQLDRGHPLVKGRNLTHCWLFNEGGGNGHDLASNLTATLNSSATWAGGALGGPALKFPNLGKVTFTSFTTAANWSWAAWVNWDGSFGSFGYDLILGDNTVAPGMYISGASKFNFYHGGDHLSTSALTANKWYLLGVSNDSTNNASALYINGVKDVSFANNQASVVCSVMGTNSSTQQFTGLIDSMLTWDSTLTDGDHARLFMDPFAMLLQSAPKTFSFAPPASGFPRRSYVTAQYEEVGLWDEN